MEWSIGSFRWINLLHSIEQTTKGGWFRFKGRKFEQPDLADLEVQQLSLDRARLKITGLYRDTYVVMFDVTWRLLRCDIRQSAFLRKWCCPTCLADDSKGGIRANEKALYREPEPRIGLFVPVPKTYAWLRVAIPSFQTSRVAPVPGLAYYEGCKLLLCVE